MFADVKRGVPVAPHRLLIELSRPSGNLLSRLALPYACPVPLGFPIDVAGVPLMVGSGPYQIAQLETDRLVLARNCYYRGDRPHWVDRIVISLDGDFDSNIRAVEDGRSDVNGAELPFGAREPLVRRYGVDRNQLFRLRGTVPYYLAFNTSRPLFRRNLPLRRAVNLALDRTAIVKSGAGGPVSHMPTDQIVPRWVPGWVERRIYPLTKPDLRRANRLASGNRRGGKAVLYAATHPGLVDQAHLVATQLEKIGLEVAVTPLASAVVDERAGTPGSPYDMVLTRYIMLYPDPADVMIRLLAGENARRPWGNTNFAYFDSPRYNRRIAAVNRLAYPARSRAFSELDVEIMRNAVPWAPLFEGSNWVFVSKRVGCVKAHPVFRFDFAAMCLRS